MAKTKAPPAEPVEPAAPTTTFREAADASAAARGAELDALVTKVADPVEPPSEAPAPSAASTEETYEQWYDKQPARYREQLQQQIVNKHAEALGEYYGPEVSALLAEIGQDPELKKKVSRMTDKQYRQWLLDTSTEIYDDPKFTPAGAPAAPSREVAEMKQKLDGLEKSFTTQAQQRQQQEYLDRRKVEYNALLNTFPELKWTDQTSPTAKRVLAVLERAEAAHASYADTYAEMRDMWASQKANPPPPTVPRAQASPDPQRPQAPRTKVEAKQAIKATLDKYGSLSALNAALRK